MKIKIFLLIAIIFVPNILLAEPNDVVEHSEIVEVEEVAEPMPVYVPQDDFQEYPGGKWKFIEDELLLVPGYPAMLYFIPKAIVAFLAYEGIQKLRGGTQNDSWFKRLCYEGLWGPMAGYATAWGYRFLLHAWALNRFFKNWEKHKRNVPKTLYKFLEKEHGHYLKGGKEYIILNTKRVIRLIKSIVRCRESRIHLDDPKFAEYWEEESRCNESDHE